MEIAYELSPAEREAVMKKLWKKKGIDKFVSVKSLDDKVSTELKTKAGVPMYYPVSFDKKGRQYMGGYPLNPQGSKETRPLFVSAKGYDNPKKALKYVEAYAADLFGKEWKSVSEKAEELVEGGYLSPATIAACTSKGKPDIAKLATLREVVKLRKEV